MKTKDIALLQYRFSLHQKNCISPHYLFLLLWRAAFLRPRQVYACASVFQPAHAPHLCYLPASQCTAAAEPATQFFARQQQRVGGGGVGPSHPRLSLTSLANEMPYVQSREANTRRGVSGSFGLKCKFASAQWKREEWVLSCSLTCPCSSSLPSSRWSLSQRCCFQYECKLCVILSVSKWRLFAASFCSVTCCLVVMCNVHCLLFSLFATTLIWKPVYQSANKKEIRVIINSWVHRRVL